MRTTILFIDMHYGDEFTCKSFHGDAVFVRARFCGINKETGEEVEFDLEDPVERIHGKVGLSPEGT